MFDTMSQITVQMPFTSISISLPMK